MDSSSTGDHLQELETEKSLYPELHLVQNDVHAEAKLSEDGRLDIVVTGEAQDLQKLLDPVFKDQEAAPTQEFPLPTSDTPAQVPLNIVIQIVGSRGDVQPFIAIGKQLKEHGHRVRLATHPVFKSFVEDQDLEFFSIGGDPAELMAFMVKNPGLIPGIEAIRTGEIGKRRTAMTEMIEGCWRSCIEAGDGMTASEQENTRPFAAHAIIANPPSFAHVHCAERLRIPVHIMFTMPWSPTQIFPHPLANIQSSSTNPNIANYLSYALVETMTWQGLGDLINGFRKKTLGLSAIESTSAPGMITRLKIPHTYIWSPALVPKPKDWGPHISVTGFCFLPLASTYTPPDELAAFLAEGPPPVYIGFGSIVVDDPDGLTALIISAVKKAGVRALISQGWGGLRVGDPAMKDSIYLIGNCPHDWLFGKVSCVVHHGGAGTTAAGISGGKPTAIVPFFGDQPFWGDMIARSGAGPPPIPHKELTADKLANSIRECLRPSTADMAVELSSRIQEEKGAQTAVSSFHAQLPLSAMFCNMSPARVPVWRVRKSQTVLSALAAFILIDKGLLSVENLELYGPSDYDTAHGAFEPVSGSVTAATGLLGDIIMGFSDVVRGTISSARAPPKSESLSAGAADSAGSDEPRPGLDVTAVSASETKDEETEPTQASRTTKGAIKIATALIKSPMDMTVAVTQGLHNAPKMYGDRTVRPASKITGIASGLVAGGKELGFGVYDGFSGVVTQPLKGRQEGGTFGMYKGIGKGVGGLLLKPIAGVSGLFGFTMKGIYEEVRKAYGTGVESSIGAAHLAEGHEDWKNATEEECAEVLENWERLQAELANSKTGKKSKNRK